MLYFPQLSTGAVAQYPLIKRRVYRTVTNRLADGRRIRLTDAAAQRVEWEIAFEALSDAERQQLEQFFTSTEGRLREFTFLDPAGNLLAFSEELTAGAWTRGPLLTVIHEVADPLGGNAATRLVNTGLAEQQIQQSIAAPGWFHYCFSFYARSEGETTVTVFRATGGNWTAEQKKTGPTWRRLTLGGASASEAETVTFGVTIAPGDGVELYGLQAEPQPAPSSYVKTPSAGGVYQQARFDHDQLTFTSEGPEQHGCTVRIAAPLAS